MFGTYYIMDKSATTNVTTHHSACANMHIESKQTKTTKDTNKNAII